MASTRQRATTALALLACTAAVAAWATIIVACVHHGWWLVATDPARRFEDLYERFQDGSVLLHGGNLYALRPQLNNTNPPFVTIVYLPLRALGRSGGAYAMTLVSTACVAVAGALCLTRVARMDWRRSLLAASIVGVPTALLLSFPLQVMYREGQVRAVVLLLVVADVLVAPRRFKGIGTGVAAGLTLTPLAFVLVLGWRDGRAAVLRAIATMVATIGVGLAAGFGATVHFWFSMLPSGRQLDLVVTNAATVGRSIPDFGLRSNASLLAALARPPLSNLLGEGAAKVICAVLGLAVLGVIVPALRHLLRRDLVLTSIALMAVFTLVFSPVSWEHYWVWGLLCPFVAIELWQHGPLRVGAYGAIVLFAALATDSLGVSYRARTSPLGSVLLIPLRNLYPFAGLVFLAAVLIGTLRCVRADRPAVA